MSDFTTTCKTDASQRVKYSLGMVLGVDEFVQEQAYFLAQNRLANRMLHGSGTVFGLDVRVDPADKFRLRVSPGMAIDPLGRVICVPTEYCGDDIRSLKGTELSQSTKTRLFLVLRYRECDAEPVAMPSPPCSTGQDAVVYARIQEGLELDLVRKEPKMPEEIGMAALRDEIYDIGGLEKGEDAGSLAHPSSAEVRAQLLRWVTAGRPRQWTEQQKIDDPVVLLAGVTYDPKNAENPLTVDQSRRPFMLSTRTLQELLRMPTVCRGDEAGGDLDRHYPDPLVTGLQGRKIAPTSPLDGQILGWDQQKHQWEPVDPPAPTQPPVAEGITLTDVVEKVPTVPLFTVTRLDGVEYELWFHPELADRVKALVGDFHVAVYSEIAGARLTNHGRLTVSPDGTYANVFRISVPEAAQASPYLRFVVNIDELVLTDGTKLPDWMRAKNWHWPGFDGETVTVFYRVQPASSSASSSCTGTVIWDDGKPAVTHGTVWIPANDAPLWSLGMCHVKFPGYDSTSDYVVHCTPLLTSYPAPDNTSVTVMAKDGDGILIRSLRSDKEAASFTVEICPVK